MAGERNTQKYDYLSQMKTGDLEELLRADMASPENSDPELLLHIMEVIEEREKDTINDKAVTERAWREFQKLYNTPEGIGRTLYPSEKTRADIANATSTHIATRRRIHHSFRRAVLIAAVVAAILVFMVPTALGYESFSQMIGQWTKEVFQFHGGEDSPQVSDSTDEPEQEENRSGEYESLQEALADYDIPATSVPSTVPDGFELQSIKVSEYLNVGELELLAYYLKEDSALFIAITQYSGQHTFKYEKSDSTVENCTINGVVYYLLENVDQATAVWNTGPLEGSIYGDISTEDIKMMINSIS